MAIKDVDRSPTLKGKAKALLRSTNCPWREKRLNIPSPEHLCMLIGHQEVTRGEVVSSNGHMRTGYRRTFRWTALELQRRPCSPCQHLCCLGKHRVTRSINNTSITLETSMSKDRQEIGRLQSRIEPPPTCTCLNVARTSREHHTAGNVSIDTALDGLRW